MQINLSPNVNSAAQKGLTTPAKLFSPTVQEGDSISARVIFAAGDTVHLKTEEGGLIRAHLQGGTTLAEGSEVKLTVAEKTPDTITLRIDSPTSGSLAPTTSTTPALPPALLQKFEQLRAADMPLQQKLEQFVKALSSFPTLATESSAVQQAASLLASSATAQATTGTPATAPAGLGQLLADLAALLEATPTGENPNPQPGAKIGANPPPSLLPNGQPLASMATTLPLQSALPGQQPPASPLPGQEGMANLPLSGKQNPLPAGPSQATQGTQLPPGPGQETQAPSAPANTTPPPPATAPPANTMPPLSPQQRQELISFVEQVVTELYPPGQSEAGGKVLSEFIGRMFARLGDSAQQDGAQLHKSVRELEPRLEFMKEAIVQSSLPQREEAVLQTERILQQSEALREARLLCMQIPVQLGQERKTAELYAYRREGKGGRKLDPQNATIMLALNTEHLGRLEAMIQTRGKEINLKLEIGRAEAVPFLREQGKALPGLLAEAGFKLASSSVGPLRKQKTTPQAAEEALQEFQKAFGSKLNFLI